MSFDDALSANRLVDLQQIADTLEAGQPIHTVAQQAQGIQQLWAELSAMPSQEAAIWLRGAVAGYQHALAAQRIEVVETLAGAGSALTGREPAAAFAEIPGVRLWQWPPDQRPTASAKMHAKIAVADRRHLLVSSVNLTESGVENSIEAGVVIHGGHAPRRFAEHIDQLCALGVLARL